MTPIDTGNDAFLEQLKRIQQWSNETNAAMMEIANNQFKIAAEIYRNAFQSGVGKNLFKPMIDYNQNFISALSNPYTKSFSEPFNKSQFSTSANESNKKSENSAYKTQTKI